MYNPFAPHIVEFSAGGYAVRKLTLLGWRYYDSQRLKQDNYWWTGTYYQWYVVESLEDARALLHRYVAPKVSKVFVC